MENSGLKDSNLASQDCLEGSIVSFQSHLPVPLMDAMNRFVERYPNWDQYRLIKAALAGFLVQNGVNSRSITRMYISNMFGPRLLLDNLK